MPITAPTLTGQFSGFLDPAQAEPFFTEARRNSVIQSLVRKRAVGINGQEMPVKLSKLTAGWVAEAGRKPSSQGALGLTSWRAHKMAAIAVVSAEVVRANPGGYMDDLRPEMGEAFGILFDQAVISGTGSPFGTAQNLAAATKTVTLGSSAQEAGGVHADFNAAVKLVVTDLTGNGQGLNRRKNLTGWVLDSIAEPKLNGAVDLSGRPLYIESPYEGVAPAVRGGAILGRPSVMAPHIFDDAGTLAPASVIGYGADWDQMVWGTIGGISYDVSTQATVTIDGALVSLWENNLLAIRAEAEYAFVMKPGIKADSTVGTPADPGGALASVVKLAHGIL